ncbi:MAG: DEAD/DEAH box helicase family protein [Nanoarchaeota archaeon]
MNSKNAFSHSWNYIETKPTILPNGYKIMREWQEEAFNFLNHHPNWILNAPMASGKSLEICYLATEYLLQHPDRKVVISVPQTIIASGFTNNYIQFPDGKQVKFIPTDLCNNKKNGANTQALIDFITKPNKRNDIIRGFNKNYQFHGAWDTGRWGFDYECYEYLGTGKNVTKMGTVVFYKK